MSRGPGHVAVATGAATPRAHLEEALHRSRFWEALGSVAQSRGDEPAALPIVVLVALRHRFLGSPAGADPLAVEALVDILADAGYTDVTLGSTPGDDDRWLAQRDPVVVADLSGFRFVTEAGNMYDVVNLADDVQLGPLPPASCLEGVELPARWLDAGFRIDVAAAATDEVYGYSLCLHNLLALLPARDAVYHYEARRDPAEVACDLLRYVPPNFNIVTALTGSHGRSGTTRPRAITTDTVVAGDDTLLCDWVAAAKMGTDPGASPLNAKALATFGLPGPAHIEGDLASFEGWENPHPLDLYATRRARRDLSVARLMAPLTAQVDAGSFPFNSAVLGRANRLLSALAGAADRNPAAQAASVWLNLGLGAARDAADAWNTLYAKQRVRRREVSLGIELDQYQLADYEAVVGYLAPLEQLVAAAKPGAGGLRWRYLEESVLFSMSREFPVPFESFVERVDVAQAITMMADYVGGRSVAVARDEAGRVTHQAERNLYLPQPNYLVLSGGDVIDVAKLEHVRYHDGEHKIFWRTVASPNGSATYDDGTVAFSAVGPDKTKVSVMARQQFTLPLLLQLVDLDRWPEVKDRLVADAYVTYFDATLDNFFATYEGRQQPVGRPWLEGVGEPGGPEDDDLADLAAHAGQILAEIADLAGRLRPLAVLDALHSLLPGGRGPRGTPRVVDGDGFVHVAGRATSGAGRGWDRATDGVTDGAEADGFVHVAGRSTGGAVSGLDQAVNRAGGGAGGATGGADSGFDGAIGGADGGLGGAVGRGGRSRPGLRGLVSEGGRALGPVTEFWAELARAAGRDLGVGFDR